MNKHKKHKRKKFALWRKKNQQFKHMCTTPFMKWIIQTQPWVMACWVNWKVLLVIMGQQVINIHFNNDFFTQAGSYVNWVYKLCARCSLNQHRKKPRMPPVKNKSSKKWSQNPPKKHNLKTPACGKETTRDKTYLSKSHLENHTWCSYHDPKPTYLHDFDI